MQPYLWRQWRIEEQGRGDARLGRSRLPPLLQRRRPRSTGRRRWRRPGAKFNGWILARVLAWKNTWCLAWNSPHYTGILDMSQNIIEPQTIFRAKTLFYWIHSQVWCTPPLLHGGQDVLQVVGFHRGGGIYANYVGYHWCMFEEIGAFCRESWFGGLTQILICSHHVRAFRPDLAEFLCRESGKKFFPGGVTEVQFIKVSWALFGTSFNELDLAPKPRVESRN